MNHAAVTSWLRSGLGRIPNVSEYVLRSRSGTSLCRKTPKPWMCGPSSERLPITTNNWPETAPRCAPVGRRAVVSCPCGGAQTRTRRQAPKRGLGNRPNLSFQNSVFCPLHPAFGRAARTLSNSLRGRADWGVDSEVEHSEGPRVPPGVARNSRRRRHRRRAEEENRGHHDWRAGGQAWRRERIAAG